MLLQATRVLTNLFTSATTLYVPQYNYILKLGCVGVSSSFPKIDYNFNQLVLRAQGIFFGSEKSFEMLRG